MGDYISWIFSSLWNGIYGFFWTILHLGQVLNFSEPENVFRFIYYGGSAELLAVVLFVAVLVFVIGLFRTGFLWGVVRGIEGISNAVGRVAAWAALFMVLQQVLVIFLQSIFRVADIGIGPFGLVFEQPIGWYADSLKLYNALIVCLCCAYTFVQGGHVRVDLFYAGWSDRMKNLSDMIVTLFFMIPALVIIWFYGWFYLWRHMVNPNVSAVDPLERVLAKKAAFRWNIETFAASPSGFNAYFLFKIMLVSFAGLMILQAIGFFYRSWLEFRDETGERGKYLDKDVLEDDTTTAAAAEEIQA